MKKAIAALVLMAFLPVSTTGCFGGFQLTRKVYQFNREVSPDKWVQELVFLAMAIFPVYGAATFLDAIIFNSVEFWTGNNPVLAQNGASRKITTAEGTAVLTRTGENALDLRIEANDGRTSRLVLQREGDGFSARTPEGDLIARVAEVDGEPMLFPGEI